MTTITYGTDANDRFVLPYGATGDRTAYLKDGRDAWDAGYSSGVQIIYGQGGDDYIRGGSANDELHGGAGNDELNGMRGDDYIFAGAGQDHVMLGYGSDRVQLTVDAERDIITLDLANGDDSGTNRIYSFGAEDIFRVQENYFERDAILAAVEDLGWATRVVLDTASGEHEIFFQGEVDLTPDQFDGSIYLGAWAGGDFLA